MMITAAFKLRLAILNKIFYANNII